MKIGDICDLLWENRPLWLFFRKWVTCASLFHNLRTKFCVTFFIVE